MKFTLFNKQSNVSTIQQYAFLVIVVLLGIVTALQMIRLCEGFSIGKMMYSVMVIVPCVFLLILVKQYDLGVVVRSLWNGNYREISLWIWGMLIGFALVCAAAVVAIGTYVNITYLLVGGAILVCFFISLGLAIRAKASFGIGVMLLSFPFVKFMEYSFQGTWLERVEIGAITLTPQVVWIIAIFLINMLAVNSIVEFIHANKTFFLMMCIYVGWAFLSCAHSFQAQVSMRAVFLEIACPLMFFVSVLRAIESKKDIYVLIIGIVGYLVITASAGLYFFYQQYGFIFGKTYFYQQNFMLFNIYRMATIALAVVFLLLALWEESNRIGKWLILGLIGIFSSIVLLSQTRLAFLCAGTCFGLYMVLVYSQKVMNKKLMILLGVVLLLILGSMFLSDANSHRILNFLIQKDMLEDHNRAIAWKGSWEMIKDYPLWGIGYKMWDYYVARYMPPTCWYSYPLHGQYGYIQNPHNFYLAIGVFFGIPCLVAFMMMNIVMVVRALGTIVTTHVSAYKYFLICIVVALASCLLASFGGEEQYFTADSQMSVVFLDFSKGFIFFFLLAVLAKRECFLVQRESEKEYESNSATL